MGDYEYEDTQRICSFCPRPRKRFCVVCKNNECLKCAKSIKRYCRGCFKETHNIVVETRHAEGTAKRWKDLRAQEQNSRVSEAVVSSKFEYSKKLCVDMQPPACVSSSLANLKLLLAASSLCSSPDDACQVIDESSSTYTIQIVDHIGESRTLSGHGGHLLKEGEFVAPGCYRCRSKVGWGTWLSFDNSQPFRVLCAACFQLTKPEGPYERTHVTDTGTKGLQRKLQDHSGEKIEVKLVYQPLAAGTKDIRFSSHDIKVGWH